MPDTKSPTMSRFRKEKIVQRLRFRRRRPQVHVGKAPGQVVADKDGEVGEMQVIRYTTGEHTVTTVETVGELEELLSDVSLPMKPRRVGGVVDAPSELIKPPSGAIWINIDGLGDANRIKQIGRLFGIHPLALEDVVSRTQRAKFELYGDTIFFIARMPSEQADIVAEQISLFLIDNVVITIQERSGDCLGPVRKRIKNSLGRIRKRRGDYLLYAIVDAIIDGYFPVLQRFGETLDSWGTSLKSHPDPKLPLHLHEIRADLLHVSEVLRQHREALTDLLREGNEILPTDTLLFFRDCQDHISQLIESATMDRETCGEMRELHFAMLGQKNNDVMKVLTIIATIFIPMSFVAGVYGMNFDNSASQYNMPELEWIYGYPFAIGIMGVLASGLLVFLYRKGWLS